jgi:hypothetical protein
LIILFFMLRVFIITQRLRCAWLRLSRLFYNKVS